MINKLDNLIYETTRQIKQKSVGKNGLIRKIYLLDKKKWYEFNKPDDYGDILPFISIAENNIEFAKKQYFLWKKRMIEGIPIPKHVFPLPPFLEIKNIDDFIHGFSVISASFENPFFLKEGKLISNNIIKKLQTKKGFYASVCLPFINIKLPEGISALKPRKDYLKYFADALGLAVSLSTLRKLHKHPF